MLTRFQDQLQKLYSGFRADTFLLAVSGGLDSMVMLDLFRRSKLHFEVAHVNFGLRGPESDEDEAFVHEYCQKRNIFFHCRRVETKNYATGHGLSIQMAARELRYGFFNELISQGEASVIVTAHHANDNVETILMGLIRGGGPEILTGIPSSNKNVIRPLLFARREELENYAALHSVTWREDNSNSSDDYVRNVIRHNVIPKLKEINPSLERAFERTVVKAKGQQLMAHKALIEWEASYLTEGFEEIRISKQGLRDISEPIPILFYVLEKYGFNFEQTSDVVTSIDSQSGKVFHSVLYRLVIDREDLIITQQAGELRSVFIDENTVEAELGPYRMEILRTTKITINTDPHVACLDAAKITLPLQWRSWQQGDIFHPLGMEGHKKVSDFLIDAKVSLPDKDRVTVVQSGNDIVWVAGLRLDHRYRLTERTAEMLVLRIEKFLVPGS